MVDVDALREELLLALRFSQAVYGTVPDGAFIDGDLGLDKARWDELLKQPASSRKEWAEKKIVDNREGFIKVLMRSSLETGDLGIVDAVVTLAESNAALMDVQLNAMEGDGAVWLLPNRKMVVIAWRGSQQFLDYLQD